MNSFTFENSTRIHFGEGKIEAIADDIPKDKKVLVTYGGGSIKKNGVYDQVKEALKGHAWDEFSGIEPNPQYDTLMQAVEKVKAENFDYLLAVGGGSVVDGTKFIAAASLFEGDPWNILEKQAPVKQALPLSCILTLPATGSETNIGAVVSKGNSKLYFHAPPVRPVFAVLDPKTTLTLSPRQVANGVIDAFVHTMEQYVTFGVDAKVQDRFAEGLLLTLLEEGPKALSSPDDLKVRANIMLSATLALNGLIGSGVPQDWTTHMIGHELTGHFGIDHGRSLSIVMPAMLKVRRREKEDKLLQYGERIFGITGGSIDERIDRTIGETVSFFKIMNSPTSLADENLGSEAIDVVVKSLEKHKRFKMSERQDMGPEECRKVLEAAL